MTQGQNDVSASASPVEARGSSEQAQLAEQDSSPRLSAAEVMSLPDHTEEEDNNSPDRQHPPLQRSQEPTVRADAADEPSSSNVESADRPEQPSQHSRDAGSPAQCPQHTQHARQAEQAQHAQSSGTSHDRQHGAAEMMTELSGPQMELPHPNQGNTDQAMSGQETAAALKPGLFIRTTSQQLRSGLQAGTSQAAASDDPMRETMNDEIVSRAAVQHDQATSAEADDQAMPPEEPAQATPGLESPPAHVHDEAMPAAEPDQTASGPEPDQATPAVESGQAMAQEEPDQALANEEPDQAMIAIEPEASQDPAELFAQLGPNSAAELASDDIDPPEEGWMWSVSAPLFCYVSLILMQLQPCINACCSAAQHLLLKRARCGQLYCQCELFSYDSAPGDDLQYNKHRNVQLQRLPLLT